MNIKTHHIITPKTARYSSYGDLGPDTKYFWMVLHGSKMTCEQVLYKFKEFDPREHFIIAPEGLSRFYLEGFGGEVVATWMTKRDRLEEIKDFSTYLSNLFQKYHEQLSTDCKKIVMGFSQGGTTMYRWLHDQEVEINHLIAYSCWIPEDIDLQMGATSPSTYNGTFTYGMEDPFLTSERIEAIHHIIEKNKLELAMEPYKGDHRILKEQLQTLFLKYIKI